MISALLAAAEIPGGISVTPDAGGLPGGQLAKNWVKGVAFYGLVFTAIGSVLSGGLWAVGSFSNNYTQSVNGKKGFLVCAGAALAIGATNVLVKYFYDAGQTLDT